MAAIVELYMRQVWSEKSYTSGTDELVVACIIGVRAKDGLRAKKGSRTCNMPAGLGAVHMSLSHIMLFRSNKFLYPSLFQKERQVSLNQRPSTWQARFRDLDEVVRLDVECNAIGLTLTKVDLLHPAARREVCVVQLVCTGNIV